MGTMPADSSTSSWSSSLWKRSGSVNRRRAARHSDRTNDGTGGAAAGAVPSRGAGRTGSEGMNDEK